MLTFAITPGLYVDDGEEGLAAARARKAAWRRREGELDLGDLGEPE